MALRDKFRERLSFREGAVPSQTPVDLFDFVFGEQYLHFPTLFPSQSLALKLYYRLWDVHPFTAEEQALIDLERTKWGINIDLEAIRSHWTQILLLPWGRRSGKSAVIAGIIIPFEIYKLICIGNPHKHYGILQGDTIFLQVTAAKEDQAKKTFSLGSKTIKSCKFFEKYIDPQKDLESELRLCTPYDLLQQQHVIEYNASRPKGEPPRKRPLGSIAFWTTTTSAGTSRGGATLVQVFEEFAQVRRARKNSEEEPMSGGMSDYELYKALAPATKTFGKDGKVIEISSPREEGGEFYAHYKGAVGDAKQGTAADPHSMALQFATWEANPHIKREDLQPEFDKDPLGATQEYGSEFGKPAASFISLDALNAMIDHDRHILLQGNLSHRYVVALDPASRSDTYAGGWGHAEVRGSDMHYCIDGLVGWRPRVDKGIDGVYQTHPIDHTVVLDFIASLCTKALARKIMVIAYDQWQSTSAIDVLKKLHLPAMETTFTNSYKALIYKDLLEEINSGRVHVYGIEASPEHDWVNTMILELQYLQRIMRGDIITYHHPSSGPVQHDDFADVAAQIVSLLKRFHTDQRGLLEQMRKTGLGPIRMGRAYHPMRGARIR